MYRKVLKLSKSAFLKTSPGQIINLIGNDINKLEYVLTFLPYPFVSLVVICLTIFLLWTQFEYSVLIGVLTLFTIFPVQMVMSKLLGKFFAEAARRTDERIRLMNEFIPAIKIIKVNVDLSSYAFVLFLSNMKFSLLQMYCWEMQFARMIDTARKREVRKIKAGLYAFSVNLGLFYVTGKIVVYSCLISYVLFGNLLRAESVFMAFALLTKMSFVSSIIKRVEAKINLSLSITSLSPQVCTLFVPHFVKQVANSLVCLDRIKTFLCLPETKESALSPIYKSESIVTFKGLFSTYDHIEAANCTDGIHNEVFLVDDNFNLKNSDQKLTNGDRWPKKDAKSIDRLSKYTLALKNINFECVPGDCVTVVGSVGSGKSSILMAILNETNTVAGTINVKGRISYSCQEAWTFAGTVRENILFGNVYNEQKYKEVVRVCALERDMTLFPQGDQTIVGEQGVALSGGQKARINLARALYFEADIYLLDDPLSAVDPHVAKSLFKDAIREYLSDKIVILVTHQLQFVKKSTKVLLIKDGGQVAFDDYNSLLGACQQKVETLKFLGIEINENQQQESNQFGSSISIGSQTNRSMKSRASVSSIHLDTETIEKLKKSKEKEKDDQKLNKRQIIKEVTTLQLSSRTYYVYAKLALAGWLGPTLIMVIIGAQINYSYSDYFLSLWVTSEEKRHMIYYDNNTVNEVQASFVDNLSQRQSIMIYSAMMIALFTLGLLRALFLFKSCLASSVKLHDRLFKKVVGSPISFFETNPIGKQHTW